METSAVLVDSVLMQSSSRTQPSLRNYKDVKGLSWQEGAEWSEVKVDWWTAIPVILAFIMSSVALGFGISGFVIGKDLQSDMTNVTKNFTTAFGEINTLETEMQTQNEKPKYYSQCTSTSPINMVVWGDGVTTEAWTGPSQFDVSLTDADQKVSVTAFKATDKLCSFTQTGNSMVHESEQGESYHYTQTKTQLDNCAKFFVTESTLGSTDATSLAKSGLKKDKCSDPSDATKKQAEKTEKYNQKASTEHGVKKLWDKTKAAAHNIAGNLEGGHGCYLAAKNAATAAEKLTLLTYQKKTSCNMDTGKWTACLHFESSEKYYTYCGTQN